MLQSGHHGSISYPTSPSNVVLNIPQNLDNILRPRVPLVPETVNVENPIVQTMNDALDHVNIQLDGNISEPPRLRARQKINYRQLHNYGRKY